MRHFFKQKTAFELRISDRSSDVCLSDLVLEEVGQLSLNLPEVAELGINPLLAGADGVIALDARIRIASAEDAARPAIRPYPHHLVHDIALADGSTATVRPIRPEDEPAIADMLARSSPADLRLRFFAPTQIGSAHV